jgi:hypothetical protein
MGGRGGAFIVGALDFPPRGICRLLSASRDATL